LAQRAAEEGATLMLSDMHERRLGETADRIAALGLPRPETFACDVTQEEQVQALVAAAIDRLGSVDVLVNNAGLGGNAAVVEMTDDQWFRVIDVTLNSVFRMTRAILPHMYGRQRGAIVNNASVLGWRAQKLQSHYAAAKAGVMAFTRCSALEAAEHGVRINAVAPSFAMHPALSKVTPPGLLEELVGKEAFGRAAEPWEVANVMLFLASDLSSYMTGEVLSVSSQQA
jgi:3-oxoacyl-[acyl-carrier protein] reductase